MQALIKHNEERELLKISRLESGRVSHRVLAIRDIVQVVVEFGCVSNMESAVKRCVTGCRVIMRRE